MGIHFIFSDLGPTLLKMFLISTNCGMRHVTAALAPRKIIDAVANNMASSRIGKNVQKEDIIFRLVFIVDIPITQ